MSQTTSSTPAAVATLNRTQKLAAVLLMLEPDNAAAILKGLEPSELAAVAHAMVSLPPLDETAQQELLREFAQATVATMRTLRGSVEAARPRLEAALGAEQTRQLLQPGPVVAVNTATPAALMELAQKQPRQILTALRGEPPATAAIVLSFLEPRKATEVLNGLPESMRAAVLERLATLGPTPQPVLETLGKLLLQRIGPDTSLPVIQAGGIQPAVSVLKVLPKDASKTLLSQLEHENPDLSAQLRNQMFTFADLLRLSTSDLQKVLREVDARILATALKGADEAVRNKIMGAMSKRAAEALQEEMSFLTRVKSRDIDAAQLTVIEIVRRLESDGQIEIPEEAAA
ncbi:MAG: hypothetical protein NZ483_07680 [Verrucomicrobiae bacterium]|nr:hypothetical protein [Verrucomicrobiae bacterium]